MIDPDGKQLGVIPIGEALRAAANFELDLVEVSSKTDPPVCRIMDYGKFKYQQSKKAHDAKKKQAVVHIKEVKMRPKTEEHDFQFKLKHIERFLKEGNKIKVTIVFRGRELAHPDIGRNMAKRITEESKDWAKVEQQAKFEGRNFVMILAPVQAPKPASEKPAQKKPAANAPAASALTTSAPSQSEQAQPEAVNVNRQEGGAEHA